MCDGFGRANLPYGVDDAGRVVVAYQDSVIDLASLDLDVGPDVWMSGSLMEFFSLGPQAWALTRGQIQGHLDDLPATAIRPRSGVRLVLPWEVADYTDFYACEEHATAMGRLLRPGAEPLPAAWRHLPMGYHGRSSTVLASGEEIPRPSGLRRVGEDEPQFGPTARLDVEVEVGFVIGAGSGRGRSVPPERAGEHVFGVVLVNDWSA
ncbi:MAG: fumarylacetoacetate hydrolase family protein, partial [Acidimicrobiales bacterium]